jgi:GrpB protein
MGPRDRRCRGANSRASVEALAQLLYPAVQLKTRQDVATKYAALKRDLARNFRQDPRAYGEAKGPFIESMIARYTDDSAASPAEASAQEPPAVSRTPLTTNARHQDHTPQRGAVS